ncbi:MAG: phosphoglycerate kinase [Gemmatimonadota bacterium]
MPKKSIKDIDLAGTRILARVDFNVPLDGGEVQDDFRIQATLPTLRCLLENGAGIALCSHLGRPKGEVREDLRMDPVGKRVADLLGRRVKKLNDCVGPEVEETVGTMGAGDIVLLENTRFHSGEKENDPEFGSRLARGFDIFVNDAFAAAHRAHASTAGVAEHLPAVAGLLMKREMDALEKVRINPEAPFSLVMGGAKISDKIPVLDTFREHVGHILVGGGIANTLLKARGVEVGDSLVEEDSLEEAGRILDEAGDRLVLPSDVVVAESREDGASRKTVEVEAVPEGWQILDVGDETMKGFQEILGEAATVLWNGPLGLFEMEPYQAGTFVMARTLAELDATTITGGGETAAAVSRAGVMDGMTHVSTGGGAFLEFMQGKTLPGIAALQDG